MSFKDWLDSFDPKTLLTELEIAENTLIAWKKAFRLPKTRQIYRIVKMAKGKVTYADIIEPYYNKPRR